MNLFYYTLFFSSVGVVRKEKAGLTLKTCMLFYSWSFQYSIKIIKLASQLEQWAFRFVKHFRCIYASVER